MCSSLLKKKEAWSDTLILIGGRRKNHAHEYRDNSPRDIRVEPLCGLCVLLKISYVSNHETSITLLIYQNVLTSLADCRYKCRDNFLIMCVGEGDFLLAFSFVGFV